MLESVLHSKNSFPIFGAQHIMAFTIFVLLTILLIWIANSYLNEKQQVYLGTGLSLFVMLAMFCRMGLLHSQGLFSYKTELPLYICRLVTFFLPFMMFYKSQKMFGVLYFWILAGTFNALVTPDIDFGFPHYTAIIYWILHGGLVSTILYAIFVYKMRPKAKDMITAFWIGLVYLGSIHGFNLLIDANYSYTMQKPAGGSILDHLGPWPLYLFTGQILAFVLFLILYLPWFIKDRFR